MAVQKPAPVRTLNHYQILMLDPSVDDEVLTAVYRRMLQRVQLADLDERRRVQVLRRIKRAYAVLHDPAQRRAYDLELAAGQDAPSRPEPVEPITLPAPAAVPVQPARTPIPVAKPTSSPLMGGYVLDFGRYAGFSLRQIALRDRDYLEWLRRTPAGRQYQTEITAILTPR